MDLNGSKLLRRDFVFYLELGLAICLFCDVISYDFQFFKRGAHCVVLVIFGFMVDLQV